MKYPSAWQRFRQHLARHWPPQFRVKSPRRLECESLESRLSPACTPLLSGGVLSVSCNAAADTVTLDKSSTHVLLTLNGSNHSYTLGSVNSIAIDTDLGNDTLNVRATPAGKPTVVHGGPGNDTFHVGGGDPFTNLDGIAGSLTLHGEGDADQVTFNDLFTLGSFTYTLTANSLARAGGSGMAPISFSNGMETLLLNANTSNDTIHVNATQAGASVTVNAGAGNDLVNVHTTSAGSSLTVNAGADNDTVRVSPTAQNLNQVQGTVTAFAGAGNDVFNISDQNSGFNGGYTLDSVPVGGDTYQRLDRTGFGQVRYRFFNGVGATPGATFHGSNGATSFDVQSIHTWATVLNTGTGVNTVNVRATSGPLTVHGESGLDAVNVGNAAGSLQQIAGALHVTNAGSYTALNLNDTADGSADTATLSATGVTGLAPAAISWVQNDLRSLIIRGGSGGNTFHVNGTPANGFPVTTSLSSGAGSDVVNVRATGGALAVLAGTGNDTINLGSAANTLDAILGALTVSGNDHTTQDVLNVNDQGFAAVRTFTLTSTTLSWGGPTVTYGSIERMVLNAGSGNDRVNIHSTHGQTPVTVNAGPGDDHVELHDLSSLLDGIQGAVTVNGQGDTGTYLGDGLELRDDGNLTGHTFTFTANQITRTGMAPVTYTSMETVGLMGGLASDTFHVHSTGGLLNGVGSAGGSDTYLVGGPGNTLAGIQGPLNIAEIGDEVDTLILNDHGSSAARDYAVTATEVNNGSPYIVVAYNFYGTVENIVLNAAGGGNTFLMHSLHAATALTLNAGAGSDTLNMLPDGLAGFLTVNGQGGINALNYEAYAADVTVNLPLGTATDIAGGISNIRDVTGGAGHDVLVGDHLSNALAGGPGRDLLIGGGLDWATWEYSLQPDVLNGGAGEDILIGGFTAYDLDPDSLNAIRAAWAPPAEQDPGYAARVANLYEGVGAPALNEGSVYYNYATGGNTLTGGDELDLFFGDPNLDPHDWDSVNEMFVQIY